MSVLDKNEKIEVQSVKEIQREQGLPKEIAEMKHRNQKRKKQDREICEEYGVEEIHELVFYVSELPPEFDYIKEDVESMPRPRDPSNVTVRLDKIMSPSEASPLLLCHSI